MTVTNDTDVYYDPYDVGINADPYPTYARLRDEAPIYYNESTTSGRCHGIPTSSADWPTGKPSPTSEATSSSWSSRSSRCPAA